jgi:hypothetical protein
MSVYRCSPDSWLVTWQGIHLRATKRTELKPEPQPHERKQTQNGLWVAEEKLGLRNGISALALAMVAPRNLAKSLNELDA